MKLQGGVINGPKNPQFVFRSTLTGEVRNEDAELTVDYVNGKGQTGVLFGINARPLTEGHGRGNGVLLNLIPAEPIIAFRKFHFADNITGFICIRICASMPILIWTATMVCVSVCNPTRMIPFPCRI